MDGEARERYDPLLRHTGHYANHPLPHSTCPLHHSAPPPSCCLSLHYSTHPLSYTAPPFHACRTQLERTFLSQLMKQFFSILDSIPSEGHVQPTLINYCERFLELMADLEVSALVAKNFRCSIFCVAKLPNIQYTMPSPAPSCSAPRPSSQPVASSTPSLTTTTLWFGAPWQNWLDETLRAISSLSCWRGCASTLALKSMTRQVTTPPHRVWLMTTPSHRGVVDDQASPQGCG